jgi:hypothetical protein
MKTLTFKQMQSVKAGSLKKTFACISQVSGGMTTLASLAAIGCFGALGPVGWALLIGGGISLISGAIADPYACD